LDGSGLGSLTRPLSEIAAASRGRACPPGALELNRRQLVLTLAGYTRGVLLGEVRGPLKGGGYAQVQSDQRSATR
jgi:hypothetical protein